VTVVDTHRHARSFQHDAFIYDSDDGYLAALAPLLLAAHAAGDTVMAIVSDHQAELVRSMLGDRAAMTEFVSAEQWYEHPVRAIAACEAIFRGLPGGTRACLIGEVQFGDTEADWAAWTRYESAINTALVTYNAHCICPYDQRLLPSAVVEHAKSTHPYLLTTTETQPNVDYLSAAALFPLLPPTAVIPGAVPNLDLVIGQNLRTARHAFATAAAITGLGLERIQDLTLAVNEVLTNAVLHGGGTGRMRVWATPDQLTCAVDDAGSGIQDLLLGYSAPPPGSRGGYGLWLARSMFDRSEFLVSPNGGVTVLLATRT
jgi:anti-sigma regulatory factor (Ser/Thr protein kinase)